MDSLLRFIKLLCSHCRQLRSLRLNIKASNLMLYGNQFIVQPSSGTREEESKDLMDMLADFKEQPKRVDWNMLEKDPKTRKSIEIIRAIRNLHELNELSIFLFFLTPRVLDELGLMLSQQKYMKSLKLNLQQYDLIYAPTPLPDIINKKQLFNPPFV